MKHLILAVLFVVMALFSNVGLEAQTPIPRLNIQYGDSNCHTNSTTLWVSLPDRGLTLEAVLITPHWHVATGVIWISTLKVDIPFRNKYGQMCHLLAWPELVFPVPMYLGYGSLPMFAIPMSNALIGLELFAQGAIDSGVHEEWTRGVRMVIQ